MKNLNIAFFLTPKGDTLYLYRDTTVAQAIETLKKDRHTAVPVLNTDGTYYSVVSEGDLLWALTDGGRPAPLDPERMTVEQIPHYRDYKPVLISAAVEDLYEAALQQSFVPVVDDNGIYIGLIRRRDILKKTIADAEKARRAQEEAVEELNKSLREDAAKA